MDISMDIHRESVDMDMDMDGKFHIHGKPEYLLVTEDARGQMKSVGGVDTTPMLWVTIHRPNYTVCVLSSLFTVRYVFFCGPQSTHDLAASSDM